jgi:hypothetical protein
MLLRTTQVLVGRRASGFVPVAQCLRSFGSIDRHIGVYEE